MRAIAIQKFLFVSLFVLSVSVSCSKMESIPSANDPQRSGSGLDPFDPQPTPGGQPTPPPVNPTPSATPPPLAGTPPSAADLEKEGIGTKMRVHGVFDRWTINSTVTGGRGTQWAEVTAECWGRVETQFALTSAQWSNSATRGEYYKNVNKLIEEVGQKLVADMGNKIPAAELPGFYHALKALAWQESNWQHYLRYKNWFFVKTSGGSYNALEDWGISQVARSGFQPNELLNAQFFQSLGHCGITSSLYYGYTEYYDNYMEARALSCNNTGDPLTKLIGAYNRYSSGYSACHNGFSPDAAYRDYQTRAMNGFKSQYQNQPWTKVIGP